MFNYSYLLLWNFGVVQMYDIVHPELQMQNNNNMKQ